MCKSWSPILWTRDWSKIACNIEVQNSEWTCLQVDSGVRRQSTPREQSHHILFSTRWQGNCRTWQVIFAQATCPKHGSVANAQALDAEASAPALLQRVSEIKWENLFLTKGITFRSQNQCPRKASVSQDSRNHNIKIQNIHEIYLLSFLHIKLSTSHHV